MVAGLGPLLASGPDRSGGDSPRHCRVPHSADLGLRIAVSSTHNVCKRCGDIIGAVYSGANVGERAAEMIAALTDPQVVRTFVVDYGWDWDDWHAWTVDSLAQLVLPDTSGTGRP